MLGVDINNLRVLFCLIIIITLMTWYKLCIINTMYNYYDDNQHVTCYMG